MPSQTGEAPTQIIGAVADDAAVRVGPALHRRQAHDRLERRARREGARQRLVQQRTPLIVRQRPIDVGRNPAHEQIGIERRRRHHGQDVAVAHVHHHARSRLFAEHLQRTVLHVGVQRQHDFLAGHCGARAADVLGHHAAARVHLDPVAAGLAAQFGVQRLFHPQLADPERRVEQDGGRLLALLAHGLHVTVRDLGHIADDVGERPAERVVAGVVHVSHDARQLVGVQVDLGELFPGQVALDRHGRKAWRGVDVADDRPAAIHRVRQELTQQIQRLVQILGFVPHHQHAEARPVAGDHHPVAVLDHPARRRRQAEVELVVRRQRRIFLRLHYLQLAQPSDEGRDAQRRHAAEDQCSPEERSLALVGIGEKDRRFAAHRNLTSPSSNRSSIQAAMGNRIRVGIT